MLIGLHGKKGAGKDTVYERLVRYADGWGIPVERRAFGDAVYECAAAALGVDADTLRALKNDQTATVELWSGEHGWDMLARITVRQHLQGHAHGHRKILGEQVWLDTVDLRDHDRKIVVITDVRYRNEAQAVSDAGGVVVRVFGPTEVENADDDHESEMPLPACLVDHAIVNAVRDGFDALDAQVLELVLRLLREERQ